MCDVPDDVAEAIFEALESMHNQSPEHRGPYAPSDEELSEAKDWLFDNADI